MFHNLLTTERKKSLEHEYYVRVATVAAFGVSFAVLIGLLTLFPSYMHLRGELSLVNAAQASPNTTNATSTQSDSAHTLERSAQIFSLLKTHLHDETMKTMLDETLAARPAGVEVTGFAFDRATRKLTVEGVADTRDVFLEYIHNLEEQPRFTDVPHPIADLAKNTDLPFRLTFGYQIVDEQSQL